MKTEGFSYTTCKLGLKALTKIIAPNFYRRVGDIISNVFIKIEQPY